MSNLLKYLAGCCLFALLLPGCYYGSSQRGGTAGAAVPAQPWEFPADSAQAEWLHRGSSDDPGADDYANELEVQLDGHVVYDYSSRLMWQRGGSQNYMSHSQTRSYVDSLNQRHFAGFSDWRLPTLAEATTILEKTKSATGLHISPLFSARQYAVWTADFKSKNRVWVVYFGNGYSHYDHTDYGGSYVRAVR